MLRSKLTTIPWRSAISWGGNAFLPVLFFLANLLSGKAVLPHANSTDIYLSALGILLVSVYLYGLIFRPRIFKIIGLDSLTVLFLYIIGIAGLFFVARGDKADLFG